MSSTLPVTSISPVFGRMLVGSQLEEAVIRTLKYWFPTYLSEIARQTGLSRNNLPQPTNYSNRNSFDTEKGEQVPKIVVLTPGLNAAPTKTGQGVYRAVWRLGVGVAASGKDEQSANLRVKAYAAAIRGIMMQQAGLDGSIYGIMGIDWVSESYDDIPIQAQHQLFKGANVWFLIEIHDLVTRGGGPTVPTIDPIDWPTVEEVFIDLEKVPVTHSMPKGVNYGYS